MNWAFKEFSWFEFLVFSVDFCLTGTDVCWAVMMKFLWFPSPLIPKTISQMAKLAAAQWDSSVIELFKKKRFSINPSPPAATRWWCTYHQLHSRHTKRQTPQPHGNLWNFTRTNTEKKAKTTSSPSFISQTHDPTSTKPTESQLYFTLTVTKKYFYNVLELQWSTFVGFIVSLIVKLADIWERRCVFRNDGSIWPPSSLLLNVVLLWCNTFKCLSVWYFCMYMLKTILFASLPCFLNKLNRDLFYGTGWGMLRMPKIFFFFFFFN